MRFKKNVVIGGIEGHQLEPLAQALVDQARADDTVEETKVVLHHALTTLILTSTNSQLLEELSDFDPMDDPEAAKRICHMDADGNWCNQQGQVVVQRGTVK